MFLPSFELTSKPFSKCFTAFHAKWERIRLTFMNFQTDVLYPNYANRVSTGSLPPKIILFFGDLDVHGGLSCLRIICPMWHLNLSRQTQQAC